MEMQDGGTFEGLSEWLFDSLCSRIDVFVACSISQLDSIGLVRLAFPFNPGRFDGRKVPRSMVPAISPVLRGPWLDANGLEYPESAATCDHDCTRHLWMPVQLLSIFDVMYE